MSQVEAIVPGMMVDRYRIVRKIGHGGFGEVFEAEQLEPVHRRVALKLILQGMNTKEVMARFDAERQALAMMEHPNIAQVFDAGTSSSGQPFFVMELVVDGVPINQYCDDHKLSIPARLRLIAQACAAIQHAHGKGIVHRDLKPGNILVCDVQGEMTVKVIDFGVAKALSGRLTDLSLVTKVHQVIGTLQYMSPEQIIGSLDIDTRTDVYALGAVLYEVLTGQTPLAFEGSGDLLPEIQRIIREIEPIRPSSRVSGNRTSLNTRAAQCSSSPGKLKEAMRGELDQIVMKALDKARDKRYETTSALAADLQRYLDGQPVLAVPHSWWYRFQKLVRRNKLVFGAAASVFLALAAGVVGFAWQARVANTRSSELAQVVEFQRQMLAGAEPEGAGTFLAADVLAKYKKSLQEIALSEADQTERLKAFSKEWQRVNSSDAARDLIDAVILKPAVSAIERQFVDQPVIAATLRQSLADRYYVLGKYADAMALQTSALETRRKILGPTHHDTLFSMSNMATLLDATGEAKQSRELLESVYAEKIRTLGERNPDSILMLTKLGEINTTLGDLKQAQAQLTKALDLAKENLALDHELTHSLYNSLGNVFYFSGDLPKAAGYLELALVKRREKYGDTSSYTLASFNNLGSVQYGMGNYAKAKQIYQQAYQGTKKAVGENHPDTLYALNNLATAMFALGEIEGAEPLRIAVLTKRRELLGNESTLTLMSVNDMATLRRAQGRMDEAEKYAREFLATSERTVSSDSPFVQTGLSNLGSILLLQGNLDETESLFQRALLLSQKTSGEDSANTLMAKIDVASVYNAQKRALKARDLLTPIEKTVRAEFAGALGLRLAVYLRELGIAETELNDLAKPEKMLLESYTLFSTLPAPSTLPKQKCAAALAALYEKLHLQQPSKGFEQKAKEWVIKAQASLSAP